MRTMLYFAILFLAMLSYPSYAGPMGIIEGYSKYCKKTPEQCPEAKTVSIKPPLLISPLRWKQIVTVNTKWNFTITPKTDLELYFVSELWTGAIDEGDCEEYVLAKRREFLEMGFSPSQLLLAVVHRNSSGKHLVLIVRTMKGNFVLDNLVANVVSWEESQYTMYSHQRPDYPSLWSNDALYSPT